MDGIVLASNGPNAISDITQLLHKQFKLKNLGNLNFFLGLEIAEEVSFENFRGFWFVSYKTNKISSISINMIIMLNK